MRTRGASLMPGKPARAAKKPETHAAMSGASGRILFGFRATLIGQAWQPKAEIEGRIRHTGKVPIHEEGAALRRFLKKTIPYGHCLPPAGGGWRGELRGQ